MLHIATVHYKSARWIPVQLRFLRENVRVPFQTWTSLEGIDPRHGEDFDHVLDQKAPHPEKLNHMAIEIRAVADDEDLLLFLDGDAFPVADIAPLIEMLSAKPLVAVRRAENDEEPYPHPCFCLTTVGFWRTLPGDWSRGYTWRSGSGLRFSDVGANLWRTLQLQEIAWEQLLRSNAHRADDIRFGVYGGIAYHHGSGFHGITKTARGELGPHPLREPSVPLLGSAAQKLNRRRHRRWSRAREAENTRLSEVVFERLARGETGFLDGPADELYGS